jgi:hypothetical protein
MNDAASAAPIVIVPRGFGSLQGPLNARYGVELAKGDSEQARAQQHEAGRSQGEEAVGHEVMIAHVAPVTLDARPKKMV